MSIFWPFETCYRKNLLFPVCMYLFSFMLNKLRVKHVGNACEYNSELIIFLLEMYHGYTWECSTKIYYNSNSCFCAIQTKLKRDILKFFIYFLIYVNSRHMLRPYSQLKLLCTDENSLEFKLSFKVKNNKVKNSRRLELKNNEK